MPVTVTPVATIPLSVEPGLFYASSTAVVTTSGMITASGPWFIETQSLEIDYSRVPGITLSGVNITLSSVDPTFRIDGSHLVAKVTASYSRRKVYGNYAPSSYSQPQKFEWHALSADAGGNSYGTLGGSALGPVGKIVTVTPHVLRRLWVSATDTETTKQIVGVDFGVGISAIDQNHNVFFDYNHNQIQHLNNFQGHALPARYKGSFLSDWEPAPFGTGWRYYIDGAYSPTKETLADALHFIDSIGYEVMNTELYAIPPYMGEGGSLKTEGIADYDINRHDYS